MTTYLEQITALGEADGLAHTGWNYPDTYRQTEVTAYLKGYDRGYWFREYRLGHEAGYNAHARFLNQQNSEAWEAGYKEGNKQRHICY